MNSALTGKREKFCNKAAGRRKKSKKSYVLFKNSLKLECDEEMFEPSSNWIVETYKKV